MLRDKLSNILNSTKVTTHAAMYVSYKYNRYKICKNLRGYEAPLNPFKILYVSPKHVERFTGRIYPPWKNAKSLFGSVKSGDWDMNSPIDIDTNYRGTPPDLYLGDTFTDSLLHQSLENHFVHDVPWQDTRLVNEVLRQVEDPGFIWKCTNEQEVGERCELIDQLYDDIKNAGKLSVRMAEEDEGHLPLSILNQMTNHILVDIARDGTFLFVEGRHRLSIAKILELERIPVAVCVRHRKWMKRREQIYQSGELTAHPDCTEWVRHEKTRVSRPLIKRISKNYLSICVQRTRNEESRTREDTEK